MGQGVQNTGMGESTNCRWRWWGALRLALLLGVSACFPLQAAAHEILVVSSDTASGFRETSDALLGALQRQGLKTGDVVQLAAKDAAGLDLTAKQAPRVIITLGSEALRVVLQKDTASPVLAGLIPRAGLERLMRDTPRRGSGTLTALYLDQPLGRQLDALRLVLPSVRRVGVLLGPESSGLQGQIVSAARQRSLALSLGFNLAPGSLSSALRTALDDVDVLLAVADTQVYNSGTLGNILLTTYRSRIPVIAFSPAYVRAGALMSLHSTPAQVGAQLGQWARTVLQGGTLPAGGQYPADFAIAINDNVARSLGLDLDAEKLEAAVRQGERRP